MKRIFLFATALLSLTLGVPFAGWTGSLRVLSDPACGALFRTQAGWLGGDGAYSVRLDETRVLWLFGDSLLGRVEKGRRFVDRMVHNSVAIQEGACGSGVGLRFSFGQSRQGEPDSFFVPRKAPGWFWPLHGVVTAKGLYVFLVRVMPAPPGGPFGFRPAETILLRVSNPGARPDAWPQERYPLPWKLVSPGRTVLFGSSLLRQGRSLYIYGTVEGKDPGRRTKKSAVLARVPGEALEDFAAWQFLATSGWKSRPQDLAPLCAGVPNEYAVVSLSGNSPYLLVYSEDAISDRILIRESPSPEGPWGAPRTLFRCPEAQEDHNVFCYAAKAHPAISSPPGALRITYVAGSLSAQKAQKDPSLYRPRVLRIFRK